MSRSGYTEDYDDQWALIRWRGAVASAIRGNRGQAFLREMLAALDAMPEKSLIAESLVEEDGSVCAMGAVAVKRGLDMSKVDPEDPWDVAAKFGVNVALVQEIAFQNDEGTWKSETPQERWARMRMWVIRQIKCGPEERGKTERTP